VAKSGAVRGISFHDELASTVGFTKQLPLSIEASNLTDTFLLKARILNFGFLLILSWCVMTFTHEMGHIIGGTCCGGTLVSADLAPWRLPYSIFEPDPLPLATLWCGPILGVLAPLTFASLIRRDWSWFVSNFCTLANGVYIATAWFSNDRYLDTPQLLSHGAHPLMIGIYCVTTIGFGYVGFRRSCLHVFKANET